MVKKKKVSEEVVAEAMQVAKSTQKPGQTKEQTKLIALGIQKGIEEYKKRNKEKARSLDKQKKRLEKKPISANSENEPLAAEVVVANTPLPKQQKLPWILLLLSWCGFALCLMYLL